MSRKNKRQKLPPHRNPSAPMEPEDIDQEGALTPAEKAILARSVANYGEAAGAGVTELPPEYRATNVPIVRNVPNVPKHQNAGIHPVYVPEKSTASQGMKAPALGGILGAVPSILPPELEGRRYHAIDPMVPSIAQQMERAAKIAEAGQKIGATFFRPGAEDPGEAGVTPFAGPAWHSSPPDDSAPIFFPAEERFELACVFEQMAKNIEVGAEAFAHCDKMATVKAIAFFQQAIHNLLITSGTRRIEPLDLRGLVALTHRGQEDKHNRRALLDLCARLDISAAELTLQHVKDNLAQEAWRLGSAGEEIPELTITPENEALWREYLIELGLQKRPGR